MSAVGSETAAVESISPYAAPYVTEMLGKGQALAATPYQAYTGPLTAGPSALQSQAFSGLGSLALPAASGAGSFTGAAYGLPTDGTAPQLTTSPTSIVQQYMNPYLEAALNPTIQKVKDETSKAQQELQSQYAKAGGYGGGRQAVAEAGLQNRALDRIGDITAQGYQTAYDKASQLFGDERRYGLDALRAQQMGGREQQAIEQQGVAADYMQFKEERDDPFKKVQYMQSLLQGLPIEAVSRDYIEPSGLSQFLSDLGLAGTAGQLFFGGGSQPGGTPSGIFTSDMRLKENITHVGVLPNGANWYTWDWNETGKAIAGNQPTQGVMAQELQEINADAVITGSDGYLRVDYSKV